MEHRSTFQLMIGNCLVSEHDVMAEVERYDDGEWFISAIHVDLIERDGIRCSSSRDWERIPPGHFLFKPVMDHFESACCDDINDRWSRHSWRYTPTSQISAGRAMA
jgi:hypothetical protein